MASFRHFCKSFDSCDATGPFHFLFITHSRELPNLPWCFLPAALAPFIFAYAVYSHDIASGRLRYAPYCLGIHSFLKCICAVLKCICAVLKWICGVPICICGILNCICEFSQVHLRTFICASVNALNASSGFPGSKANSPGWLCEHL